MRRHFCLLWFTIVVIVLPVAVQAQTEVVEYYVTDAIGSIRLVFDPTGGQKGRMDYGPFGRELAAAQGMSPDRFGGQETDSESNQGYFHARMFQSRTGRFTSPDPGDNGILDPQRWNRYTYALNNGMTNVDPSGLDPFIPYIDPGIYHCVFEAICRTTNASDGLVGGNG